MGFDIHGIKPKHKGKRPEINWKHATDEERDAYFKAMDKFEEENPGVYFRNNVWWWRPLAELIHDKCGDLLSEQQRKSLQYNDGTAYTKQQAIKIANRLSDLIKNGYVDDLQKSIEKNSKIARKQNEKMNAQLKAVKDAVQKKFPDDNLVPRDYPEPYKTQFNEAYALKNWDDSYPFNKENVEAFINFARHSGGFRIC